MGWGWNWNKSKVVDVVHSCILAKYLDAGVTDPNLVLETKFQDIDFKTRVKYTHAISSFDNAEGDDRELEIIKELSKKLKMRIVKKVIKLF